MTDARLQVFCKAPVAGAVKTRLALPDEQAAQIHRELASGMIARCLALGVPVELWCAPDTSHEFFQYYSDQLVLKQQQGEDLGGRMLNAAVDAQQDGAVGVIVGTDCPTIDAAYLSLAINRLANHDAVIGPAEDGGYGLIALKTPDPRVFSGIDWGSDTVLDSTCRVFNTLDYHWALLPLIWDVDRPADLQRWRQGS